MTPEEVAEQAYSAGNLVTCDGYYEFDLDAAVSVIRTAMEAYAAEKVAEALDWQQSQPRRWNTGLAIRS